MKRNRNILLVVVAAVLWLSSCVKELSMSGAEQEARSLAAWMRLNKPDLVGNYQENGGYYVEVLAWGDEDIPAEGNDFGSEPLMEQDTCWVFTDMTGYSLDGNVCLTRTPLLAEMNGTFSYNTHYVPYVNYCGNVNLGLLEGSYLSMRNTLTLGADYLAKKWPDRTGDFKMRRGSKVRLYMPSTIAYGETGSSAQGGYEGEYSLDANTPMIMDIEVKRAVKNPSDLELEMVERYVANISDWRKVQTDDEVEEGEEPKYHTGLYLNHYYNPRTANLDACRYYMPHIDVGMNNCYKDSKKYLDMRSVEEKIKEVFLKRFPNAISPSEMTEDRLVTKENTAKVWYVCRFLDGFILDTNIDELREYCFDDFSRESVAFSYRAKDDDNKNDNERTAIGAWYYCIPKLYFGQYAAIVTTSGYAYGVAGISGSTTTSTSGGNSMADYYAYMNYYNYYNYYYYGYGNYYNYYDYNSYNYGYSEETVETKTIDTEILPYTPLVFYLYVEPQEE